MQVALHMKITICSRAAVVCQCFKVCACREVMDWEVYRKGSSEVLGLLSKRELNHLVDSSSRRECRLLTMLQKDIRLKMLLKHIPDGIKAFVSSSAFKTQSGSGQK